MVVLSVQLPSVLADPTDRLSMPPWEKLLLPVRSVSCDPYRSRWYHYVRCGYLVECGGRGSYCRKYVIVIRGELGGTLRCAAVDRALRNDICSVYTEIRSGEWFGEDGIARIAVDYGHV
jgi:hypothetical protein